MSTYTELQIIYKTIVTLIEALILFYGCWRV